MKLVKVEDAGNPGGGSSSSSSSSLLVGVAVGAVWPSLLTGSEMGPVVPLVVPSVSIVSVVSSAVPFVAGTSCVGISCFISSMVISPPFTFSSPSEGPFSISIGSSSVPSGYCSPTMHTSWNQSSLHASPRRHWYIVPVSLATS